MNFSGHKWISNFSITVAVAEVFHQSIAVNETLFLHKLLLLGLHSNLDHIQGGH